MMAVNSTVPAEPGSESWSEVDKIAVQQQLDRLLATPLFHASKRYPSFLRFVVNHALTGQTDRLKERVLGVEIFGRAADYDTNTDPIVRVTAAEIRKRIEQYYHDPLHSSEIRFVLPSGSYVPQFSWPGGSNHILASAETRGSLPTVLEAPSSAVRPEAKGLALLTYVRLKLLLAVVALGAAALLVWFATRPSALKQFWEPFVKSAEPVVFCMADQSQYSTIRLRDSLDLKHELTLNDSQVTIIIDDISPLVNVAGLLRTYGKNYRVLAESVTSLTDLRRGPSVFIGAFDNTWTLRLTGPLRFHFANDPEMSRLWIEDRQNPTKRDWMLVRSQQQQTGTYKDYAIVTRFVDPNTDQYAVIAAGIGRGGTVAAGEFLIDSERMNETLGQLPRDWKKKNLELVLETQVIESRSGPPHVAAVHVW
jgi:hypothetical protein